MDVKLNFIFGCFWKATEASETSHSDHVLPGEWTSFDFVPFEERVDSNNVPFEFEKVSSEYRNLESFFTTLFQDIDRLGLIERDVDAIHKICVNLTRNVNKLNSLLMNDTNEFSPDEVRAITVLFFIENS